MEKIKTCKSNRSAAVCSFQNAVDLQAKLLKQKILTAAGSIPETGKKWYVSAHNAGGDGSTPEAPLGGLEALENQFDHIQPGDAVLFERGGIFRGSLITQSGVYYGAYGTGEKPRIYGSAQNYAGIPWKAAGENIWEIDYTFHEDVGLIVVDDGRHIGYKRYQLAELKENFDFTCDHENGYKLYLYLKGDPSSFQSIEIGTNQNILWITENTHDVTVENLHLQYTGAHGIRALNGVKNIAVKNCEISYLGGSYIPGYKEGTTRYGNGVEFWQGCENVTVEHCWIHDIYDSGISHQGNGDYVAKNLRFFSNLIEYCGMGSIEYWLWNTKDGKKCRAENVTYADNIMRFAGYGFGGVQRPDKISAHILSNGKNHNKFEHFKIERNIFDQSSCYLVEISSMENTFPALNGNTYIQKRGKALGMYAESGNVVFDDSVQSIIQNEWGDVSAKVYCI